MAVKRGWMHMNGGEGGEGGGGRGGGGGEGKSMRELGKSIDLLINFCI